MDKQHQYIKLSGIFLSVFILLQSCVTTTPTAPENPWATPGRNISVASKEEQKELHTLMQPCVDYARDTFQKAAIRFQAGLPPESTFNVVTRVVQSDGKVHQFFVQVDTTDGEQIHGYVQSSGVHVKGRKYAVGDKYSLPAMDIVDWLIIYTDRPEEGNLLGKYLLLRQDGVISNTCDPQSSEMQKFRLFREHYSFVPPSMAGWDLRGRDANSDVSLQEAGDSPNELNTIYSNRLKAPISATDQDEFIMAILETEKRNLGDPNRYTLKEHKVTAYKVKDTNCVLSNQVIEDQKALLSRSGERGRMIREISSLYCVHPSVKTMVVNLTYSHRYQPGNRDPKFIEKSDKVFQSLAFSNL